MNFLVYKDDKVIALLQGRQDALDYCTEHDASYVKIADLKHMKYMGES